MAGILDNQFMQLILSGSPYMQQRHQAQIEQERADNVSGLLFGDSYEKMGAGAIGQEPDQYRQGGLLENSNNLDPMQLQQMIGAKLMTQPGYQTHGTSLMNQSFGHQAGEREQQSRFGFERERDDWRTQNGTWYEKTMAGISQAKNRVDQMRDKMFGGLGISGGLQVADDAQSQYDKFIKPMERTSSAFYNATGRANKYGGFDGEQILGEGKGWTGADDQALISEYLSTIRPGEAQMADDLRNLAQSFGISGSIDEIMAAMLTKTAMSKGQREKMYAVMRGNYENDMNRLGKFEGRLTEGKLKPFGVPLSMINARRPEQVTPYEYGSNKPASKDDGLLKPDFSTLRRAD